MRLSLAVRVWGAILVVLAVIVMIALLRSGRLQALEGND